MSPTATATEIAAINQRLAAFEAPEPPTPQPTLRVAPPGVTPQAYWWDLARANSRVFTRRIVLRAEPL